MYEYRATIVKHLDGDTTRADVNLGFDITTRADIRWSSISAPEPETAEGKISLAALLDILPLGTTCTVRTEKLKRSDRTKKDHYRRYLGTFILDDGTNVNDWMVEHGYAVTSIYKEAA